MGGMVQRNLGNVVVDALLSLKEEELVMPSLIVKPLVVK